MGDGGGDAQVGTTRAGARALVERRRKRKRRRRIALVSCAGILAAGATGAAWATRRTGHDASAATAIVAGTSTSLATTTSITTTIAPNDLLAPFPTVLPTLDNAGDTVPLVSRVDTTDRVVFVTIDDGQVRDPTYLDHFRMLGVPFTSFLTQPMATADPAFWAATEAAGGTIQTHTITHPNLRGASESTARKEICGPADTFTRLFGRRPTLFRPPYGNSSDTVRRVAAECGYRAVVYWTGSTNNGVLTMQDVVLKPGDIILMHYRDTLHDDLNDVVNRVRAEGFTIGRLEDYLAFGA